MLRRLFKHIGRSFHSTPIAVPRCAEAPPEPKENAEAYRATLLARAGPEPWCIDSVSIADGILEVTGWAIPRAGSLDRMAFLGNDAKAENVTRGIARPDVGSFYWYYPKADASGFHLRMNFAGLIPPVLRLSYADAANGLPIAEQHDFHLRTADLTLGRKYAAPPLGLIQRTHTGNSEDQYFAEGFTMFQTIDQQFTAVAGRSLAATGAILDFGCGPGRLTRYLAGPDNSVTAVDVDPDCIGWCSVAFPDVRCLVGALRPPLPLGGSSFDCILAINVLLHLREADALTWLEEWARLLKQGGILIVSIASAIALTRARLSAEHYAQVEDLDFVELSRNPDLDEVITDRDYYKNIFMTHTYVQRRWPALGLGILGIVEGAIGNHHDLVILRRN